MHDCFGRSTNGTARRNSAGPDEVKPFLYIILAGFGIFIGVIILLLLI